MSSSADAAAALDGEAVTSAAAADERVESSPTVEQQPQPASTLPQPLPQPAAAQPSSTIAPTPAARPAATSNSGPRAAKVVYFVRHAESAYNAFKLSPVNWLTLRALRDPLLFDPPLSARGLSQLPPLSATASKWKLCERAQLLVVSPLKRAIDTALAVMGQAVPPAAAATAYPLPVYVSALCSEVLDTSADIGSSPQQLHSAYPLLDFSHLPDAWWYHSDPKQPRAVTDEPPQRVAHRVSEFLQWLCERPEAAVIVVSHSSFIRHCTGARLKIDNCQVQECTVAQQPDGRIQVVVRREALH